MAHDKVKSAAIVTLYDNMNIGNKLQNYAVQEILKAYCESVRTLSYTEANELAPDMGWKGRLVAKLGFPPKIAAQKRAKVKRRKKFETFSGSYLNVLPSRRFSEYDRAFSEHFDMYVVGSDQVWHRWSESEAEMDYFFLRFVPEHKRVCLAPSFGRDVIPAGYEKQYVDGLNGFRHLSCREVSGCTIIRNLTGRDAVLLPDPTMMLDQTRWDSIARKPEYRVPEKFILAYFIGETDEERRIAVSEISEQTGFPVIDILNPEMPDYYSTSPEEFIYLISNAQMVITNSFHACVFSVLYHKQFRWFGRDDREGADMGNRLITLLDSFGLTETEAGYDFSGVEQVLIEKRVQMRRYLDSAVADVLNARNCTDE